MANTFQKGDRVICPNGTAKGERMDSIVGVGVVERIDDDGDVKVIWPQSNDWWYHYASELVRSDDVQFSLSRADATELCAELREMGGRKPASVRNFIAELDAAIGRAATRTRISELETELARLRAELDND